MRKDENIINRILVAIAENKKQRPDIDELDLDDEAGLEILHQHLRLITDDGLIKSYSIKKGDIELFIWAELTAKGDDYLNSIPK